MAALTTSTYQTAMQAVLDSIRAKNFNQARVDLAEARVVLAGLPDELEVPGQKVKYRASAELDSLESAIDAAERAANGAGRTRLLRTSFGGDRYGR